ncbi:Factor arrest protein 11 [Malassezia sp. CBS 17886]|nr:Factor arrest protein 11 [Malassezia sp. CBS 17886]
MDAAVDAVEQEQAAAAASGAARAADAGGVPAADCAVPPGAFAAAPTDDAARALQPVTELDYALDDDCDCMENELEEFYSYVEAPLLLDNAAAWAEWCERRARAPPAVRAEGAAASAPWAALPPSARRQELQRLLAALDLHDADARLCASRALLYHLQGSFTDADSEGAQLAWIKTNAAMVLELDGIEDIFRACKRACWKHDWISALPDYLPHARSDAGPLLTPRTRADLLEEANMEITIHFAQLYAILETQRGGGALGDVLMSLSPPLPVYLLTLTAELREKSIRGFPVKKLVLLLWKTVLATLGGMRDAKRCGMRTREQEGLGSRPPHSERTPTRPNDLRIFRTELAAKYPTLVHSRLNMEGLDELLSLAMQPLPHHVRQARAESGEEHDASLATHADGRMRAALPLAAAPGNARAMPGVPQKPNKQKFQTDQSRPFVLPYVRDGATAPFSIREAVGLYKEHLYVPTGVWQMWSAREQLLGEGAGGGGRGAAPADTPTPRVPPTELADAFERLALDGDADAQRLVWVGEIYGAALPHLQSAVIVFLKLALATTASGGTSSAYARAVADGVPSEDAPNPTLEDVDIMRHREILNKGISALLLLLMKWFKARHVLMFEYLAQVVLDSNVLLLILKIFGLQEVSQHVRCRCEATDFGLFGYCRRAAHAEDASGASQAILQGATLRVGNVWSVFQDDPARVTHAPRVASTAATTGAPAPFSWRNMATAANMTRILHMVCKRKMHRILLLVQYKSTAILKRSLRVPHAGFQEYVLKIIKSQVPCCGRKWRQSNMRIITLIYLRCAPSLRDDWPGGGDMDAEIDASLPEEQTLRTLVQFYNQTRFGAKGAVTGTRDASGDAPTHRRPPSHSGVLPPSARVLQDDTASSAFERDAFPLDRKTPAGSAPGRYISDDAVEGQYLDSYEDVLSEMFADGESALEAIAPGAVDDSDDRAHSPQPVQTPPPAWTRGAADARAASPALLGAPPRHDENRNVWEHMSPREMQHLASASAAASQSPRPDRRRRSSSGAGRLDGRVNSSPAQMRPLLHWDMEDLVEDAITTGNADSVDGAEEAPPLLSVDMPRPSPKPGGIDEVEHIFGA